MKLLRQWFPSFFKNTVFTGVIDDVRTESEIARDYLHEERYAPPVPDPFSNKKIETSPYPYENQYKTSSCVPHAVALALGIERSIDGDVFSRLSPLFLYRLRANFPDEGCWLQNIFDVARNTGAPLFPTLPTKLWATEEQANAVSITADAYNEALLYRGDEYYTFKDPTDIVSLAAVAQKGHGVPILIYSRLGEWARKYPIIESFLEFIGAPIRHCVCILPKSGFWENAVRYVAAQDSSWFGGITLRYLSEEFIKKRCYGAGYWDTVKFVGEGIRPQYIFSTVKKFGDSDYEVLKIQELLIAEGLLPIDCKTGYFGGRTTAGVRAFQNKYASEILTPIGLTEPTNVWGNQCLLKANKLCL